MHFGNIQEEDIAIVTPYNGQVSLLRSVIGQKYPKLESVQ